MQIKKGLIEDIRLNLNQSYLLANTDLNQIDENVIIPPLKNYGYYTKRLLRWLNTGFITQPVYNAAIANESGLNEYLTIDSNLSISKTDLVNLIEEKDIAEIDTSGDSLQILSSLNENGYQVIKNI